MKNRIKENLTRQSKAVLLLKTLQEEEFARLMDNNPQKVSQLELAIQELLRQIMAERTELRSIMKQLLPRGGKLRDFIGQLPGEEAKHFNRLLHVIARLEKEGAAQARKNQQLSMALKDQSQRILKFIHDQIKPKQPNTVYSAKGRVSYRPEPTRPTLLNGVL